MRTSENIAKAFLLGQVGVAYYEQDGQLFALSIHKKAPEPCRAGDIGLLCDVCSDIQERENLTIKELRKELRSSYRAHTALSFLLDGLDTDLEEVRHSVIKRAEQLCQEPQVYKFVRENFLTAPLSENANLLEAINIATQENVAHIRNLYAEKNQIMVS